MAISMTRLQRSKTGSFVARKSIPGDVRSAYAAAYQVAWEEKFHLPASTTEPEAKARFGEWLADVETRIGKLRAAAGGQGIPLSRHDAYALAGRWYSWFIARQDKAGRGPDHWKASTDTLIWDVIRPHAPEKYEENDDADPQWDWKAHPRVRKAIRPTIARKADTQAFLGEQGITLTPDATNLFVDAVSDSLNDAFTRLENISRGDYSPDETLLNFPPYAEPSGNVGPRLQVLTLFQYWAKAVQPATSTFDRWSPVFRTANDHFSDATTIDLANAKAWMNGLITEERSAHTVATVWRTALKTVFAWAIAEKLVQNNPFREVRINVPRKTTERETKAFNQEEAEVILAAALACDDTKSYDERARRWVPWICAYSGARAGEITQLRGIDIQKRGGDYFARLTPSAGKIKTRKARTVPIHEHLIAQGLLRFVEAAQGGPLFYQQKSISELAPGQKPARQSPADRTRGRLGAWVRGLGIADQELSPNHAWRHTFKAKAARVRMDERYSDAITGHTPASIGRAYTAPLPEDLAQAMKDFPRYIVKAKQPGPR